MTDPQPIPTTETKFDRLFANLRFQTFLLTLLKVSGFCSLGIIHKWFPDLSPDQLVGYIVGFGPTVLGYAIDWYRTRPNNIIARFIRLINGNNLPESAKAAITVAADKVAGVTVTVNPTSASAAVVEAAKLQDNDIKLEKAP